MHRFIRKLRGASCKSKHITSDEIGNAETLWIKFVQRIFYSQVLAAIANKKSNLLQKQLGLYIDDNGVIRCQGRLDNSNLQQGTKEPILLPKYGRFTTLIIENTLSVYILVYHRHWQELARNTGLLMVDL